MTESKGVAGLYDRWSATYDTMPNRTRDMAARVLREAGPAVEGRDVVEIGCGTGVNTVWLADRARAVVALDFSRGMLEKARVRVGEAAVRFVEHDIRSSLPLPDASVDVVTIMLVLEHIEAVAPIMVDAARVLRPGGELFIAELHPYRQMLGSQARFSEGDSGEVTRVPAWHHDVGEFVNAGVAAGLVVTHLGEWRDADAPAEPPRLLSLRLRRP